MDGRGAGQRLHRQREPEPDTSPSHQGGPNVKEISIKPFALTFQTPVDAYRRDDELRRRVKKANEANERSQPATVATHLRP